VNFALNYHRALYSAQYDNAEDIWQQRWRLENKPWRIEDGRWVETYADAPVALFSLYDKLGNTTLSYAPAQRKFALAFLASQSRALALSLTALFSNVILDPGSGAGAPDLAGAAVDDNGALLPSALIYTQYHTQGQGYVPIASNYQDPNLTANSAWSPQSVPAVKAQTWAANYRDKNIADNPVHPTVPDLLIGPHVVLQRRRTKYVALSPLADDYLTARATVLVLEGEAVGGDSLQAVLSQGARGGAGGAFAWGPGAGNGVVVRINFGVFNASTATL
jgi:hypothetical protein